ncbi:hypothetical protein ACA910_021137 [Epithemia clementina (nom. ined.)]
MPLLASIAPNVMIIGDTISSSATASFSGSSSNGISFNSSISNTNLEDVHRGLLESSSSSLSPDERQPQLRIRQWRSINIILTVSLLLGLVSGTLYGYGRYSRDLKRTLDLTHFQLQLLGILLDTGNYIGHPVVGYMYDHYGPRLSCVLGAVTVFVSFGTIHLMISGVFPNTMWGWWYLLCTSFFTVGFGSGLGYTAALGSTTKTLQSVPHYRSLGVAVVAAGFGFCSTLVGLSYHALGGLDHFFLFWAILVAAVNVLGAMILSNANLKSAGAMVDATRSQNNNEDEGMKTLVEDEELQSLRHDKGVNDVLPIQGTESLAQIAAIQSEQQRQEHQQQHRNSQEMESRHLAETIRQRWAAVRSFDFWILFAAFGCCTGSGLFVINNVSTMVQSLGGHDVLAGRLVILLSISNCLGRIFAGFLADRPNAKKLSLFGVASSAMAVSLLSSAFASPAYAIISLIFTVTMVALAYGGIWVLVVGLLSDWFGVQNFGKNYGLMAMGPALAGMLFNLASACMYERHVTTTPSSPTSIIMTTPHKSGDVCLGTACYRGSFLLTGFAAVLSILLLWYLSLQRSGSTNKPVINRPCTP